MKKLFLKELQKLILTKEDFILLFEEINLTEKFIFKDVNIPLSEKLKGKIREDFRYLLKQWERENYLFGSPSQQFSFFQNLKRKLKSIPQVKLEIAFEPSIEFLVKIKQWFHEKNRQEIILDLSVNPGIVGGAIIEYKGKYCNFSLGKRIDELFLKNSYE